MDDSQLLGGSSAGAEPGEDDVWLAELRTTGVGHDAAVEQLYALLLRACRAETRRRADRVGLGFSDVDDLAQQAATDAVVAVLHKLETFRGESRFTTWVYSFAVFEVSAAVGRHLRRTVGVRLDDSGWESLPDRWGAGPEELAHARELLALLRRVVDEDLTAHQRRVFTAVVVDGVPLDVLVAELGADRNAVYKVVFDARRKIRDAFVANGYLGAAPDGSST